MYFDQNYKFIHKGQINNSPALVQIMACRRPVDKALYESMMVGLLIHICVTRPHLVNKTVCHYCIAVDKVLKHSRVIFIDICHGPPKSIII